VVYCFPECAGPKVDKNDNSKKRFIEWLEQMIETSHKYRTKIAIGGCIAKLGRGDILNCDRRLYCKTGERSYLKLR